MLMVVLLFSLSSAMDGSEFNNGDGSGSDGCQVAFCHCP
jgi:hypothetical protein